MKKLEIIYRYVLDQALDHRQFTFTQLALAKQYSFSLSTVNNAIKPLVSIGAITIKQRGFELSDARKLLYYWATIRKLNKDIIYSTRKEGSIKEIEGLATNDSIFTAYSAYKFKFKEVPADYSEIYFYVPENELMQIKQRYPTQKGPPNVFVLRSDPWLLNQKKSVVSNSQLFVDLWNIKEWYAQDFLKKLEERLFK